MNVGLGLRASKGGAAAVGVALDDDEPRLVFSTFLATGAEGDRLSLEPYRVAHELTRAAHGGASAEAVAAVNEGRARQDRLAAEALRNVLARFDGAPVVAALLVNRAAWITDLLAYSLSWPEHVPVAETLAVRDALRFACNACCVEIVELDERSLPDAAQNALGRSSAEIDARVKALGAVAGRPWRKEQKLACIAAWFALHGRSTAR